jgi:hypothetical protein
MDYTYRIPDEGEPMEVERKYIIGTLTSSFGKKYVTDIVKVADHDGRPKQGVGFLTTDTTPTVNNIYDPVMFDNGAGKRFEVLIVPIDIMCFVRQYPDEEGEPSQEDIAYAYELDHQYD